jgi:hypothetical protein
MPVHVDFHSSSTSETYNMERLRRFPDIPLAIMLWNLPDINQANEDATEISTSAQMPNEGALDLNGVIDPALMQSLPSEAQTSSSALPVSCSEFFQHDATGGRPMARDKTITVQYDSIDEAKQALLDARQKTLQKLQFINQQIKNLEGRKQNRDEVAEGLENVESSFL